MAWLRECLKDRDTFVQCATQASLVVVALIESGQERFTREDIAVIAFRAFPEKFALREYRQYPNSGKVYAILDGMTGLVACGFLEKGEGEYRLA